MRICHIITTFYESAGSSRRTLIEMRYQQKSGHSIGLIVGCDVSIKLLDKCRNEGIEVHQVLSLKKYIHIPNDLWTIKEIFTILKQGQFDIVHTHLAKAGILGRIAANASKVPVIIHTVHGPTFHKTQGWKAFVFKLLEKIVAAYTHGIIFVGQELRNQYLNSSVSKPEKSHVIYTGHDFTKYRKAANIPSQQIDLLRVEHEIPIDSIVIGYVARVVPSKGHEVAIEAFRILKNDFPDLKMIFVGKANLPQEQSHLATLRSIVCDLGFEKEILFLGYHTDIECYYRLMDLFILPSRYEGLPNVVIEAVSMGIPVVAFDCGGAREVLSHCKDAGTVVDPGDFKSFVNQLRETIAIINTMDYSPQRQLKIIDLLSNVWDTFTMLQKTEAIYNSLYAHNISTRHIVYRQKNN